MGSVNTRRDAHSLAAQVPNCCHETTVGKIDFRKEIWSADGSRLNSFSTRHSPPQSAGGRGLPGKPMPVLPCNASTATAHEIASQWLYPQCRASRCPWPPGGFTRRRPRSMRTWGICNRLFRTAISVAPRFCSWRIHCPQKNRFDRYFCLRRQ